MGWPGLWSEIKDICEEIEIKKAIFDHHLKYMKDNFHKKLEDNKYDDFSVEQPYMDEKSVEVGRTAFKIRSKMVEDIPANLKTNSEEKAETVRRVLVQVLPGESAPWPGPLCGVSRLAGAGLDQHARPGEVLPGDAEEESSKKYLTKRNLFFQSVVNRGLKAGIAEVGLVKK